MPERGTWADLKPFAQIRQNSILWLQNFVPCCVPCVFFSVRSILAAMIHHPTSMRRRLRKKLRALENVARQWTVKSRYRARFASPDDDGVTRGTGTNSPI